VYPLKWIKFEYRAVTKLFLKEGLTPNEIHSKFINVYVDSSPSFSTIKKWGDEFKRGRTRLYRIIQNARSTKRKKREKCHLS
jgi:hypothetical protein